MHSESPLEALDRAAHDGLMPRDVRVLLAVSGGADSLCLMIAACERADRRGWSLGVGHVHHGWRAREADRDLAFVRDHARRRGLPFLFRRVDARKASRSLHVSPEAGARSVRYAALAEMAAEFGAERIATAHQQDDRIESYLLALQRRGGVASMAGPRRRRDDGVVRPLLSVRRVQIIGFLAEQNLSWRRDETNGDLSLARNAARRTLAGASPRQHARWEAQAEHWVEVRDRLDRDFEAYVTPAIRRGPGSVLVDARALRGLEAELLRRAIEAAALPFARPGRAPLTGREREQVLRRLENPGDFRFEAGRRITIERRGDALAFSLRPGARATDPVYDFSKGTHRRV